MWYLKRDSNALIHIMEFITSFTIFILIMSVFFTTIGLEYAKLHEYDYSAEMRREAARTAEILMNNPGYLEKDHLPLICDFHNDTGQFSNMAIDEGRLMLTSFKSWNTTTRVQSSPDTVVYGVRFMALNISDVIYAAAISDSGSLASPNNLTGIYHASMSGNLTLVVYENGTKVKEENFGGLEFVPGEWYDLEIKKTSSGLVDMRVAKSDGSRESRLSHYLQGKKNWGAVFTMGNFQGRCYWDNFYEFLPWEDYSVSDIMDYMTSFGLARGINRYGEMSVEKISKLTEGISYDLVHDLLGLDSYENINISVTTVDGSMTYLSWGATFDMSEEIGITSRYAELYYEETFVSRAVLKVHVFTGGHVP